MEDCKDNRFKDKHPELREGEIFLGNFWKRNNAWKPIRWASKRKGNIAYDIYGDAMKESFPVFISRKEFEDAGFVPEGEFSMTDYGKIREKHLAEANAERKTEVK